MEKIYFNTRDELVAVDFERVALVQASGNYTRIIYINKHEVMLSMGISKVSEMMARHHELAIAFYRLGRSCIIHHKYLERIDVQRQIIVLSDLYGNEIRLKVSKALLKAYKNGLMGQSDHNKQTES